MKKARHNFIRSMAWILLSVILLASELGAQALSPDVLKAFTFRSIGPMRQSGRFVDFAVPELEPATIYAATGSGGLWKSTNNGTTWESIFDNQPVISIGDVAVAPSNPKIVYVGTGEATSSRSTYWGDGVYKSVDAGKTWTNMGLKESHHIGRIVVDPKNPDIVYVAALGHLYSENPERGLFKTTDGGKTWAKSLDVKIGDRAIGVCDVALDPKNPKVLYAASYDKERKPWTFNLGGPGSGIYKTVDAGANWTKLTNGIEIHPRENELIAATHGRGFFIADITPLQELDQQVLGQDFYFFDVKSKVKWVTRIPPVSSSANQNFRVPSEPNGIVINYYLKAPVSGEVMVRILQGARIISETKGPNAAGLNQVMWNMRITETLLVQPAQGGRGRGAGGGGGGFGGGRGGRGVTPAISTFGGSVAAAPGDYTIVVSAGGKTLVKKTRILEDAWFDKVF